MKQWLATFKRQLLTLYFITRHSQTPAWVRWLALVTVAYLLSPIDLIPDFIPILGVIDDLLLVPLFIALTLRVTPMSIRQRCEQQAAAASDMRLPGSKRAAVAIALVWVVALAGIGLWLWRWYLAAGQPGTGAG